MIFQFFKTSKIIPSVLIVVLSFSFTTPVLAQNQPSNGLNAANIASCVTAKMVPILTKAVATQLGFTAATTAGAAAGAGPSAGAALLSVPTVDVVANFISGASAAYQQAVGSFSNVLKLELDALAYAVAQCTLDEMTNNIVSWIKGGFKGRPNFAVNTEQLFLSIAYGVLEDFASQLRDIKACDFSKFFKNDLANAVELSAPRRTRIKREVACPFSTTGPSAQQMYNEFSVMGWRGLSTALSGSGSAFAVKASTAQEAMNRQAEGKARADQKLSWSNGFADIIDTENCNYPEDVASQIRDEEVQGQTAETSNLIKKHQADYCQTTTPGAVVEEKLYQALGVENSKLQLADNMNKIISALVGQLTKMAVDGVFKYALDPAQKAINDAEARLDEQLQGVIDGITASSTAAYTQAVADSSSQPLVSIDAVTATNVTATSATLNASVHTAGAIAGNANITFDYGTRTNNLSKTAVAGSYPIVAGFSFGASKTITGLTSNTTYYYKAYGELTDSLAGGESVSSGNIMFFTTKPAPAPNAPSAPSQP